MPSALAGRYRLAQLSARAKSQLPSIRCVDTRGQRLREGLSQPLIEALARMSGGRQSRASCSSTAAATLRRWSCFRLRLERALHALLGAPGAASGRRRALRCHYCGHEEPVLSACPSCGNQDLTRGRSWHPAHRARRDAAVPRCAGAADRPRQHAQAPGVRADATARRRSTMWIFSSAPRCWPKGHDFPRLTLVGVIERGLSAVQHRLPRGREAVCAANPGGGARRARRRAAGEVLIQTDFPGSSAVRTRCSARIMRRLPSAHWRSVAKPAFRLTHTRYLLRAEARAARGGRIVFSAGGAAGRRAGLAGGGVRARAGAGGADRRTRARAPAGAERGRVSELQRFVDAWEPRLCGPERAASALGAGRRSSGSLTVRPPSVRDR